MRGASKVILIDVNQARLDKALSFGVGEAINASQHDAVSEVLRVTHGRGADKAISANPTTTGQAQAIEMTRPGGTAVFFGGVPKGAVASIDSNRVHYNSLWIYGHYGANSSQVQKSFELAIDPKFPADKIVTSVLPLSKINEAIELTRSGEALKIVLQPNKEGK